MRARFSTTLLFCFTVGILGLVQQTQADTFRPLPGQKAWLWHQIPFFPLGDLAQYEQTMSQNRDQVRTQFFEQLLSAVERLAEYGAMPEMLIEPLANILLMFDQIHDVHKRIDVINIDRSLAVQFQAEIDKLYHSLDIRDHHRVIELSTVQVGAPAQELISRESMNRKLGELLDPKSIKENKNAWAQALGPIQYVAYGTFSNLGRGRFQVTLHMTNVRTGVTRSFTSNSSIKEASRDLAFLVFDYFQKQIFEEWIAPHSQLTWLPSPYRDERRPGFTFNEARSYCLARGYRLPYSRELMLAETGTQYNPNGIGPLKHRAAYPVLDQRSVVTQYVFIPGLEDSAQGPLHGASYMADMGQFWCVKGQPAEDVVFFEKLWALIRKHSEQKPIFQALESLRFHLGDYGVQERVRMPKTFQPLPFLGSVDEALLILKRYKIQLEVPKSLTW